MVIFTVVKEQRPRAGEAGDIGIVEQPGQAGVQGGVGGLPFGEVVAGHEQLAAAGHPADADRRPDLLREGSQLPGAVGAEGVADGGHARGVRLRPCREKTQGGEVLPGRQSGQ